MNFEQIITLVKTVSDSELTAFQYEEEGQKITMQAGSLSVRELEENTSKQQIGNLSVEEAGATAPGQHSGEVTGQQRMDQQMTSQQEASQQITGRQVTSPLVGRFYTAPGEDAEDFVKVGDRVKKGQTLAIVEAMKLMNEIESDYDGVVTKVLAENGEAVEYGQPLFCIE